MTKAVRILLVCTLVFESRDYLAFLVKVSKFLAQEVTKHFFCLWTEDEQFTLSRKTFYSTALIKECQNVLGKTQKSTILGKIIVKTKTKKQKKQAKLDEIRKLRYLLCIIFDSYWQKSYFRKGDRALLFVLFIFIYSPNKYNIPHNSISINKSLHKIYSYYSDASLGPPQHSRPNSSRQQSSVYQPLANFTKTLSQMLGEFWQDLSGRGSQKII